VPPADLACTGEESEQPQKAASQGRRKGLRGPKKSKSQKGTIDGKLVCASYNADRLTKSQWADLCVELEARGVVACAIQDHKLKSVAGWNQETYKMWFDPCHEGPNGGDAGGVGWAIRKGMEHCASVAHLPGAGPFVKWVTLSAQGAGGKSTMDLASVYVPPGPALGRSHEDIRDEVLGAMASTAGHRAAVMGDINCDLREGTAGAEAWGLAMSASGYVAIGTVGQWAGMAT